MGSKQSGQKGHFSSHFEDAEDVLAEKDGSAGGSDLEFFGWQFDEASKYK